MFKAIKKVFLRSAPVTPMSQDQPPQPPQPPQPLPQPAAGAPPPGQPALEAFPTGPGHTHICVAGMSQVGKTNFLVAFIDSLWPDHGWCQSGGLGWVSDGNWRCEAEVAILERSRQENIVPTQGASKLAAVEMDLSRYRSTPLKVHVWDVAGAKFDALANYTQQHNPVGEQVLEVLANTDALLVMIAPEDLADGNRLGRIKQSLSKVPQLPGGRKRPSVHLILTKADEYGAPPGCTGRIEDPASSELAHLWKALNGGMDLTSTTSVYSGIVQACVEIAGASPVLYYVTAAQPCDPAYGRNHPSGDLIANKDDAKHREGWNLRAVAPVFRDTLESCYQNRGGRSMGWLVWSSALVAGFLSVILLADLWRDGRAYEEVWRNWYFVAGGKDPEALPTWKERQQDLREWYAKMPVDQEHYFFSRRGADGVLTEHHLADFDTTLLLGKWFPFLSAKARLVREYCSAARSADTRFEDLPEWMQGAYAEEAFYKGKQSGGGAEISGTHDRQPSATEHLQKWEAYNNIRQEVQLAEYHARIQDLEMRLERELRSGHARQAEIADLRDRLDAMKKLSAAIGSLQETVVVKREPRRSIDRH